MPSDPEQRLTALYKKLGNVPSQVLPLFWLPHMRDTILALLLVGGLAHEAVIGSFGYQYAAKAAACIARNIDTQNLRALRICL